MLPGDGVEHGADDHLHEPLLLVVVDLHHLQQIACRHHPSARVTQPVMMEP